MKHKVNIRDDSSPAKKKQKTTTAEHTEQNGQKHEIFTSLEFKNLLKEPETQLQALNKFSRACENFNSKKKDSIDIVKSYISSSPDCVEIFKCFGAQSSSSMLGSIFRSLICILTRTTGDLKESYGKVGYNICGAIIQSHLQKMYHALGLRQSPRTITVTLKLLTMIVMQEKETAAEVANNVDFSLRCFKEVLQHNKGKMGYEVRITYIKFVLSFFMADDVQTTRKILETHGVISVIFRGLKSDPASIVQLVLTTLKEKAIKNLHVPKTAKAHFFAEPRLLSLIATLFDWNGVADITLDETMDTVQQYIRNLVYEFLYHACCPFKYGINFKDRDLGIGEKSRNHVLLDFIFQIVPLTSDSLVRNLVVEILRACPDLLPRFMSDYRLSLVPKDSEIWIRNFNIVKATYDAQPDVATALLQINSTRPGMGEDVEKIPPEKLLKMSISGIFPPNFSTLPILKHCMKSKFLEIRQNSLALMVSLLSKVKTTLNFAVQQENWVRSGYSEDEAETFLLQLQEELLKSCVNVGAIVSIWKDISGENVPMLKRLILQIFCILQEIFPNAIAEAKFDFTKFLYGIELSEIPVDNSSAADSDALILKMLSKAPAQYKWFRIIENGESPFRRLLQVIYSTKNSKTGLHQEAVMLFERILSTNNILDVRKLSESQIWINNLLSEVKTHNDTAILNFVADVCGRVARMPIGYNEILSSQERRISVNDVPKVGNEFWDALPVAEIEPAQTKDFVSNWDGEKELTPVAISDRLEQAPFQSPYPVSLMMTAALDTLQSTDSLGSEEKSILDRYLSDVFDSLFHILTSAEDTKFFAGVFEVTTTHIPDFRLHFPRIHNFSLFLSLWLKKSVTGFTQKKDDLWSFMKQWIWELRQKKMKSGELLKKVISNFVCGSDLSASDELLQQASLYFDILCKLKAESQIEQSWPVKEILCVIVYLLQKVDNSSNLGGVMNNTTDEREKGLMEVDFEPKSDVFTCKVQRSWKRFLQTPSVKNLFFEDIHLSENAALNYLTMDVEKLFKGSESLSQICTVITANLLKMIYADTGSPIESFVTDYVSKVTQSIPVLLHSLFEKHPSRDGQYFLFSVFSNLRCLITVEKLQDTFQKVTNLLENVQSKDTASPFQDFLSDCIQSIISRDVISMSHTAVGALFKFLCNKHVKKSDKFIRDSIKLLDRFPSLAIVASKDVIKFCLKKLAADKAELFAKVLQYNPNLLPSLDSIRDKLKSVGIKEDFTIFPVLNQILKSSSQIFSSESQVALEYSQDIIDQCRSFVLSEFEADFDLIFQIMRSSGGQEFLEWHFSAVLKCEYCEVATLVRSLEALESHCDSDVMEVMTLAEILFKAAQGSGKPNMIAIIFKLITSEADKKASDMAVTVVYEKLSAILDDLKMAEFDKVRNKTTQIWSKFLKRTLKDRFGNPLPMQCLAKLVPVFYDKSRENSSGLNISIFRRMLISHSKFLPIFLSEDSVSGDKMSSKTVITNLLFELTLRCDAEELSDKDLGFLLGGYGGTLSHADQNILKIIFAYEKKDVNFGDFTPFLWGKAAISSYRARKNMGDTLWKRPGPIEILSCLDATVVEATLARFPLRRRMICASQNIDDLKYFENDFSITISAAENEVKTSPSSNHGVYDPCFLLPAIFDVLKLGNLVDCKVFVRSGALSILMCGLASHCPVIRASSASCLSLYYQHAQTAWFSENNLTMYIIRCIRNSLEPKTDEAGNLVIPRLSSVVANFFSTLVKLHSTPEDHMFAALHRFLLVKPQFDLKNIPEFYVLFFSAEMENKVERTWLLNLISVGLRDMADYHVVKKKNVFRLLMCLHDSPISDNYARRQVFEILEQVCTIRSAAIDLVKSRGLVSWLMEAVTQQPCRDKEADTVCTIGIAGKRQENTMHIIRVMSTLWKTLNVSNFVAEEIVDKEEDGAEGPQEKHAALAPFRVVKQIITLAITLLESLSCMSDSISKGGDGIAMECLGETLVVLDSCLTNLDERRKWANTKREESKESLQEDICDLHKNHIEILLKIANIFVDSCEPQITTSLVTIFTLWAPLTWSKFSAGDHAYKLWERTLKWTLGPAFALLGQSSNWVEKKFEKYLKWVENWLSVTDEVLNTNTKQLFAKCYELACSHSVALNNHFLACVKIINGILRPEVIAVENEEDHGILGEMQSIRMSLLPQNE